jgi:hypothetical protein
MSGVRPVIATPFVAVHWREELPAGVSRLHNRALRGVPAAPPVGMTIWLRTLFLLPVEAALAARRGHAAAFLASTTMSTGVTRSPVASLIFTASPREGCL